MKAFMSQILTEEIEIIGEIKYVMLLKTILFVEIKMSGELNNFLIQGQAIERKKSLFLERKDGFIFIKQEKFKFLLSKMEKKRSST